MRLTSFYMRINIDLYLEQNEVSMCCSMRSNNSDLYFVLEYHSYTGTYDSTTCLDILSSAFSCVKQFLRSILILQQDQHSLYSRVIHDRHYNYTQTFKGSILSQSRTTHSSRLSISFMNTIRSRTQFYAIIYGFIGIMLISSNLKSPLV